MFGGRLVGETPLAADDSVQIQAQVTTDQLEALKDLANRRGVDANTVLQQAITTEKLLADNIEPGEDLLIKKNDNTYSKVIFKK